MATTSARPPARRGKPATYRQKRDGVPEFVEGVAERVEFDGRAEPCVSSATAWCAGCAARTVADEITGSLITWDSTAEQFSVQGGTATTANPSGRVRAVLSPRPADAARPRPSASRPAVGDRPEPR
jgi:lipopolysaccharide export system protein LptA